MRHTLSVSRAFNPRAGKRATNVSVNRELLAQACALGLNLSQLLERGLLDELRKAQREARLQENGEALEAYSERSRAAPPQPTIRDHIPPKPFAGALSARRAK